MSPDPSQSWEALARHLADVVLPLRYGEDASVPTRESIYHCVARALFRPATLLKEAET